MKQDILTWLLTSDEPWTRYRTLVDLLGLPEDDCEVQRARRELLADPRIGHLLALARSWETRPLNGPLDAAHPLHILNVLAEFGVRCSDPGLDDLTGRVMAHQDAGGAFEALMEVHHRPGAPGETRWTATMCTAVRSLHTMLAMQVPDDSRMRDALTMLLRRASMRGFACECQTARPQCCQLADVIALKILADQPGLAPRHAVLAAMERVLEDWNRRLEASRANAAVGADFVALRYPFVGYDLLHVVDALSHFPTLSTDPRFLTLLDALTTQVDPMGRYAPGAAWAGWRPWSFGAVHEPSPWLTLVALRAEMRAAGGRRPRPRRSAAHRLITHAAAFPV